MQSPVKLWRNQKRIHSLLGKIGKIITWTTIYVPPAGYSQQAPYPIAVIELDSGERITAQLVDVDPENIAIGTTVTLVVRKVVESSSDGVIPYGIKAIPI